ncbi:MAG: hypothetical protein IJ705_04500, partial [Oscillospiraceae bacterium]|nr:hypothetical protein [Oscillospiraceae bacterium]
STVIYYFRYETHFHFYRRPYLCYVYYILHLFPVVGKSNRSGRKFLWNTVEDSLQIRIRFSISHKTNEQKSEQL